MIPMPFLAVIPMPLDAVVFDMDGLLLDTEALYRTAIFAACASQGHAMVDHVHLSLIGARPSRCLALEDSYNGIRSAAAAGMATIMIPDLLPPTEEIAALCAGVLPSLVEVRLRLEALQTFS